MFLVLSLASKLPSLARGNIHQRISHMDHILEELFDKLWLRPISLPILYIIAFLGSLGYMPDHPDPITWVNYCIWAVFLLVVIIYTIVVLRYNSLPKAKNELSSVLFIIDAESDQFYKDVEKN